MLQENVRFRGLRSPFSGIVDRERVFPQKPRSAERVRSPRQGPHVRPGALMDGLIWNKAIESVQAKAHAGRRTDVTARLLMDISDRGTKRVCPTTGRKFYDLNRNPVVSPYTGEVVSTAVASPLSRGSSPSFSRKAPEPDEDEPEAEGAELVSLDEADAEETDTGTGREVESDDDLNVEDDSESDDDVTLIEDDDDDSTDDLVDVENDDED